MIPALFVLAVLLGLSSFGLLSMVNQVGEKLMPEQINIIIDKIPNKHNHIAEDSISFRIPKNKEAIQKCMASIEKVYTMNCVTF